MRIKTVLALAFAAFLFFWVLSNEGQCAGVRMKVVVLNPSAKLTQSKSVRTPLPKEITSKDIKDDGGMEIEYDNKEGAFVAIKNDIQLEPGETKLFEILLDDVWMVDESKIAAMRKRTEALVKGLRNTKAYERAALIGESMYAHMDQIIRNQNNATVSTNQHISFYRDDLVIMDQLLKDMEELEKMLVTAGGSISLDAVENADVNVKGPDSKTTWIIIFAILIFIAILGSVFYFTWQGQAGPKEKEKEPAAGSFKENKPS